MDRADGNLVDDPTVQLFAALRPRGSLGLFAHRLCSVGIERIGPAVGLVHQISQAVEGGPIAGRRDVQAFAGRKLHARRAKMQLNPVLMGMAHPKAIVLVAVQPCEGQLFEAVHDLRLLVILRRIVAGKADDARTVGPLVRTGINQRLGAGGITAQHFGPGIAGHGQRIAVVIAAQITVIVIGENCRRDQIADRPGTRAFTVREELDQHGRASVSRRPS